MFEKIFEIHSYGMAAVKTKVLFKSLNTKTQ